MSFRFVTLDFILPFTALICFVGALTGGKPLGAAESDRPNIVLIITDDQGWGDLSYHGNPVIETPNLDDLAKRGAQLTRFYVSPVCSPTRACLMTGRYNYRTRVIDTFKGHSMMDPDEQTLAELLRAAGYATGIFGKWHLGDCYPMRPQDQGFEHAVVFRGGGLAQPSEPLENHERYTNPILWRNGRQFQAEGYCTDVYFREAMQFIEDRASRAQPFFAYIATNAPHAPLHDIPDELYRKYQAKDLTTVLLEDHRGADTVARVYAMVENIDQNVGRLIGALDRLNIADNTLVIFMCDNGPNTRRYVGERRGMKSEVYEGAISSPFFAQWPKAIEAGTRSDRIAAHIDLLPTLLAAAQVEPPHEVRLDGRNLMPLLTKPDPEWPDRNLYIQTHRGPQPVARHNMAVISQRWKLVRPSGFGLESPPADAPFELYDLQSDPTERHNLVNDQPAIAGRLRAAYDAWFEDVSRTRPNNYAPPRIVVGTNHEPQTVLTWQDWQTEGSNWGRHGEWLVQLPKPASFQVTVILKSAAAGEARLRIGDVARARAITEPTQGIVFDDIAVPAGNMAVRFELVHERNAEPPYQIVLTRK
jgi:arylsulfatase/arylsulfatase A